MINISGIVLIIGGLLAPFLSGGKIPSIYFLWLGFLLLLVPSTLLPGHIYLKKWARRGILIHAAGLLVTFLFFDFILKLNHIIVTILALVLNPAGQVSSLLFPNPMTVMPDGSAVGTVSFLRATLESMFNVLTYIGIGILIGRLLSLKQSRNLERITT